MDGYGFHYVKRYLENTEVDERIPLPQRKTKSAAGYDFASPEEVTIQPNEIVKIKTGVKAHFPEEYVLFIVVRSSTAIKKGLRLCNQVGVIDADYYNNLSNEGEIIIALENTSNEPYTIQKGERIAQGIVLPFAYFADYDEQFEQKERTGGIGSTE